MTYLSLPPYSRFPAELASILFYVLAVHIGYCVIAVVVFRKPLFINKLYRIHVCYTNITLYIAFGIIRGFT
jgi:hypothetical protein